MGISQYAPPPFPVQLHDVKVQFLKEVVDSALMDV